MRIAVHFVPAALLFTVVAQAAPSAQSNGITPGTTALLVNQDEAQLKSLLQQALLHPDGSVRMIAARVAATAPHPDLSTALFAALARELDAAVATEFIRDLLLLAGPSAETLIEPQIKRTGRGCCPRIRGVAWQGPAGRTGEEAFGSAGAGARCWFRFRAHRSHIRCPAS